MRFWGNLACGSLDYLGAERGWQAAVLAPCALWALAVGWALAMPLLAQLARRWSDATHRGAMQATPP